MYHFYVQGLKIEVLKNAKRKIWTKNSDLTAKKELNISFDNLIFGCIIGKMLIFLSSNFTLYQKISLVFSLENTRCFYKFLSCTLSTDHKIKTMIRILYQLSKLLLNFEKLKRQEKRRPINLDID